MANGEDRRDQLLRSAKQVHNDLRLIERALSEDWLIGGGHKQSIAGEILRFINDYHDNNKPKDAAYFKAVDVVLKMNQQNMNQITKRAQLIPQIFEMEARGLADDLPPGEGDEQLNVVPAGQTIQQLALHDPDYLNYLRDKSIREDRYPGDVCVSRKPGEVAVREALGVDRSSASAGSDTEHRPVAD